MLLINTNYPSPKRNSTLRFSQEGPEASEIEEDVAGEEMSDDATDSSSEDEQNEAESPAGLQIDHLIPSAPTVACCQIIKVGFVK